MKLATTLTLTSLFALAIAMGAIGCNKQAPPQRTPHVLPTQNMFNDIDSALCHADSLMDDAERLFSEIRIGISADTRPTKRPPYRVISPLFIGEEARIIESN